jgi:hypothetical protein
MTIFTFTAYMHEIRRPHLQIKIWDRDETIIIPEKVTHDRCGSLNVAAHEPLNMKSLQLSLWSTLLGALFCALVFLSVSRRGALVSATIAPRQSSSDASDSRRLRIGAFNIQIFGVSKLEREGVQQVLVDVSKFKIS